MKKFFSMMLVSCVAVSCVEAQDINFTVEGTAPQGQDTLYVFYNGQMNEAAPIVAKNGKFEVKGSKPANTFIAVAVTSRDYLTAIIDGTAPISMDLANKKIAGSALNEKLGAFEQKMAEYDAKGSKLMAEWRKLKGDESAEAKDKAKQLEEQMESADKQQTADIVDFCQANKDNVLPALMLGENFYNFDYDQLSQLCDANAAYYSHPMMRRPKMQLQSLAKRRPGIKYTDLVMQDMNGASVKLSQYVGNGKYVLVDFWASWCGPCRMEMPNVKKAYELYHGKGFEVVGVSFDNKLAAWKKGVSDLKLAWPQMSDLKGWQCAAHDAYGVNSIPSNVLLNPEGVIIASDLRAEDLLKKLKEIFE